MIYTMTSKGNPTWAYIPKSNKYLHNIETEVGILPTLAIFVLRALQTAL